MIRKKATFIGLGVMGYPMAGHLKKNNIEEAESNFREALKCMEKAGDDTGQAYVLGNLGNIFFQSKQFDKAEDFYSRSLTFMEKLKDAKGIESSLGNLGSVYFLFLSRQSGKGGRELPKSPADHG